MKSQNLSITILSATAALMLAAQIFLPTAQGSFAIKDRDYQVVTARVQSGGDGLYILDNKTAQLAVFTYDPAARAVRARVKRPIVDAFQVRP